MRTDDQGVGYVRHGHPSGVSANEAYTGAETNNPLVAAVAGRRIAITELLISSAGAGAVTLVTDTGGSPAAILGPIYVAANSTTHIVLENPVYGTLDKDVGCTTTPSGNHSVLVAGFLDTP